MYYYCVSESWTSKLNLNRSQIITSSSTTSISLTNPVGLTLLPTSITDNRISYLQHNLHILTWLNAYNADDVYLIECVLWPYNLVGEFNYVVTKVMMYVWAHVAYGFWHTTSNSVLRYVNVLLFWLMRQQQSFKQLNAKCTNGRFCLR